jgi:hypothetical protein
MLYFTGGPGPEQGTTSQLAEKVVRAVGRGFIPGIERCKVNAGFSRCGMLLRNFARNHAFFSSLFSRAAKASKHVRA